MKTGKTITPSVPSVSTWVPQWSPVMKTGKTGVMRYLSPDPSKPQWSPVMKTGKTTTAGGLTLTSSRPQWSPVMKTGKTRLARAAMDVADAAAMEPGHEDREDHPNPWRATSRRYGRNGARS